MALKDKQARAKDSWHLFGGLVGRKTTPDSATLEDQPRRTCFLTEPAEVSERSERQRVRSRHEDSRDEGRGTRLKAQ